MPSPNFRSPFPGPFKPRLVDPCITTRSPVQASFLCTPVFVVPTPPPRFGLRLFITFWFLAEFFYWTPLLACSGRVVAQASLWCGNGIVFLPPKVGCLITRRCLHISCAHCCSGSIAVSDPVPIRRSPVRVPGLTVRRGGDGVFSLNNDAAFISLEIVLLGTPFFSLPLAFPRRSTGPLHAKVSHFLQWHCLRSRPSLSSADSFRIADL